MGIWYLVFGGGGGGDVYILSKAQYISAFLRGIVMVGMRIVLVNFGYFVASSWYVYIYIECIVMYGNCGGSFVKVSVVKSYIWM